MSPCPRLRPHTTRLVAAWQWGSMGCLRPRPLHQKRQSYPFHVRTLFLYSTSASILVNLTVCIWPCTLEYRCMNMSDRLLLNGCLLASGYIQYDPWSAGPLQFLCDSRLWAFLVLHMCQLNACGSQHMSTGTCWVFSIFPTIAHIRTPFPHTRYYQKWGILRLSLFRSNFVEFVWDSTLSYKSDSFTK